MRVAGVLSKAIAAAVVVLSFGALSASASTTVTGQDTVAGDLTIDPSADSRVESISTSAGVDVLWIQRMPVTKVVSEITLGNFALQSGCSSQLLGVMVTWHRNHRDDWVSGEPEGQVTYSQGTTISATSGPEPVTFEFGSPLVLQKGETYRFHLTGAGSGACANIDQQTWAHENRPVESGPATCAGYPWFYDGTSSAGYLGRARMWHEQGQSDSVTRCHNQSFDSLECPRFCGHG